MNRCIVRLLAVMMLLSGLALGQSTEYTKRAKNEVREGPGSYFRLMGILPKGVAIPVVKHQEGWVNFRTEDRKAAKDMSAWMSKNCLVEKKPDAALKDLKIEWNSPKASPSSVAAAVRGFAVRYGRTRPPAVDSLMKGGTEITAEEFLAFKQGMSAGTRSLRILPSIQDEPVLSTEYDITLAEEGIGMGIASRIAAEGLVADSVLGKYVNLLSALLVEASGAYDTPITVLVTKGDGINALSVPGGYIFITHRMVRMCHDEAELAAVIAHEIAHLLSQHGLKEIHQRVSNIRMDEAMEELDAEAGQVPGEEIQELDDFAIEAYEVVYKPRLLSYEIESDRAAAVLLAKAGYDPTAVGRMLLNIRDVVGKSDDISKEDPFLRRDIQERYDKLNAFTQTNLRGVTGMTNVERFRRSVTR